MASLRRKLIETLKTVSAPITYPIYGIKRSLTTTSTTWERTDDAVGLVANAQSGNTAVRNDFDSIYPWSDIISYNYDATNDIINAYYGDNNFAFDGSNGDVLTLIPEFYYKRWQDSTYEYIQISQGQFEGSIKSEEFSVGRYIITGSTSRVYSRSGYTPFTTHTIAEFRNYANNLGPKFSQLDWHYFVLQLLYLVEYADYNSQNILGTGYTDGKSSAHNTGGCDFLGMKSGSYNKTSSSYQVCYRGIEDIFGNIQEFVDGINVNGNNAYICYDKTKYANNQYSGNYSLIGIPSPAHDSAKSDSIKQMGYDSNNPLLMLALKIETQTSTNLYIPDEAHYDMGERIYMCGGNYLITAYGVGLFYQNFAGANTISTPRIGARLIKLK